MQADQYSTKLLSEIAYQTMLEKNLEPEYSDAVLAELMQMNSPAAAAKAPINLTHLLFCSIDNEDSKDLDQLTYAEKKKGKTTLYVAISDVDALVKKKSAIDSHAEHNTTSVYTPTRIFSMLPEKLSTNLTSLNLDEDRLAIVIEMQLAETGKIENYSVFKAAVRNRAKLNYPSVSKWLEEGDSAMPQEVRGVEGLAAALRLQDEAAQCLKAFRQKAGSLTLDTIESKAMIEGEKVVGLKELKPDRAKDLIEQFMIAANTSVTRFLEKTGLPVLRRIVEIPKDWDRIVEVALELGEKLPNEPDSKALEAFLLRQQKKDPLRFPDLSLTIVKLLGRGQYEAHFPGKAPTGHFGLALRDYTHATAPNRRFPDLISQRLVKAALAKQPAPYSNEELIILANHCSEQETQSDKVERKMIKCAAAMYLKDRVNEIFEGLVTGVTDKGTWARIIDPPVEGKIIRRASGLKVGQKVKCRLVSVDILNGFIDFEAVS